MLHERGYVDPSIFALDDAVAGKLDDVQQAHLRRAPLPLKSERSADRLKLDNGFVHNEVIAIQSLYVHHAAFRKVGKERLIKGTRALPPFGGAGGLADDVVGDISGERGEDALDIVRSFTIEVLIQHPIHVKNHF
ncbi:MAG: hypothetical protein QOJ42_7108 [Acidobacteriaceae bacterium]|nr:hypothetical protein [Acidobacteriaceae bacterium]